MTDRLNYSPNTDKFEEKQKCYPFCADLIYNIDSPLKSTLSISKSNNQRLMSRGLCLTLSISASPTTISTSATYSIDFAPSVSIPTNALIVIKFPSSRYTSIPNGSLSGCTAPPYTVSSCTGSSSAYTVTMNLSGPTFSFVTLGIPTITNPSTTTGVSGYEGYLYTSSLTLLDSLSSSGVLFTPTPLSLSAASISMATGFTNMVGATVDIVLSITYGSSISSGSVVLISFPKWDSSSNGATSPLSTLSSSISCVDNDTSASLTCTYTTGSGSSNDELTVSGLITSTKSSGDTNSIKIKNFINYPQMTTYSVNVYVNTASGSTTNTKSGISMLPTTANTFSSSFVTFLTTTVNTASVYYITLKLTTILPIGCYLRVTLPTEVSNLDSSSSDIMTSISASSPLNSPTIDKTGMSSTPKYFDLKNIVTSTSNYRTRGQSFFIQISSLTNPPSIKTSSSFQVSLYDSSNNKYEYQSTGLTVTATSNSLLEGTSPTMSATSTKVLDSVDFTLSLKTSTALSDGASASIVVTFPSQFTLTTGSCTLSSLTGFSASSCAISGQVATISNFAADSLTAGEYFKFTIGTSKIALPPDMATSSTFTIQTQLSSYTVDSISTLTWSQTTEGTLALPSTITNAVQPSSYVAYASTTYTFELYPPHSVEQNAILYVTFPSDITLPSSTTCTQIQNIGSTLSCSISGSIMTVSGGYTSGAQSFSGTQALKFSATSITNPRSLKPTSTFTFEFKSSGNYGIYIVNNPTFTATTAATFSSMAITQTVGTNGATTSYKWTFTTTSMLSAGDYFKIVPPSTISISSGPSCTGITGLATTLSCSITSGALYITVAFSRRNLVSGSPGTYALTVSGIVNAPSTYPSTAFTFQSYLSDKTYLIEQYLTATVTNSAAGTITSASVSPNSVSLSTNVIYTLTFTPVNYYQGMTLKITIPADLSITDGTQTCINVKGLVDSSFSCTYTASSREILVTGEFTGSSNPGEVSLQMPNIKNPSSYKTTNSFLLNTYITISGTNYAIDSLTSGLFASIKCATKCLTCGSSASSCNSCDTTSSYKYLYNNDCLTSCPDGYYANVDVCSICDSNCLTCSGTATTCLSCATSMYLYSSKCLSTCPTGYVASGTTCVLSTTSSSSSQTILFPFLIACAIVTFCVLIIKLSKKDTRFLPSVISLVCIVEFASWLYLAYVFYSNSYTINLVIVVLGIVGTFITNLIFICIYCSSIKNDKGFKPYKNRKKCCHCCILTISTVYWHRFFRLSYSHIAGATSLGGILTNSLSSVRILSMISICFSSLPIIMSCGYNILSASFGTQVFYSDVENIIISSYSVVLIAIEISKLSKYKLPPKESFDDRLSQSSNEIFSNIAKHSDMDDRILRKNALERIFKGLDMKHKGEDMFGDKAIEDENNPRMRYSIQEQKNKFFPDQESALDSRRVESEPIVKHKDYEETKSQVNIEDSLERINARQDTKSTRNKGLKSPRKSTKGKRNTHSDSKKNRDSNSLSEEDKDNQNKNNSDLDRDLSDKLAEDDIIEEKKNNGIDKDKNINGIDKDKDNNGTGKVTKNNGFDKNKEFADLDGEGDEDEQFKKIDDDKNFRGINNREEEKKLDFSDDDNEDNENDDNLNGNDANKDKNKTIDPKNKLKDNENLVNDERGDELYDRDKNNLAKEVNVDNIDDDLNSDNIDNLVNINTVNQNPGRRMNTEEIEQPLDDVINRNEDSNIHSKSDAGDGGRIIRASEGRSGETSNGVLETPPPPDDSDIEEADNAAVEIKKQEQKQKQKPKVYYSDKSESSVESMMGDTPSNYNIPNGRFDTRSKGLKALGGFLEKYPVNSQKEKADLRKPQLDIITEIEAPSKAPSNLNTIKHIKTTKNERNFIDSVLGSDKNSFTGDNIGGPIYNRGGESDRGPPSDQAYTINRGFDARRHSKSNMRGDLPAKSLEQNSAFQHKLKYNKFMNSNNGSDNNSAFDGFGLDNKSNIKDKTVYEDDEFNEELKSKLPPIRYPKLKKKVQKKKKLTLIEDKNLSITNVNDLESAYLSAEPARKTKTNMKDNFMPPIRNKDIPNDIENSIDKLINSDRE